MSFNTDTQVVGSSHYDGAHGWLQTRHERRAKDRGRPFVKLKLVREPNNPADKRAVAVTSTAGIKLGHLPADVAIRFAPLLDGGYDIRAFKTRSTWSSIRLVTPGSLTYPKKAFKTSWDAGASEDEELAIL